MSWVATYPWELNLANFLNTNSGRFLLCGMKLHLAESKNSRLHTNSGLPITGVSPKLPLCSIFVKAL
jgi:hypothetical protein